MSDHRLVYYSSNRIIGTEAEIATQIHSILDVSRRNNVLVNVTGALMFTSGYFGQVLEGPAAAVEATFERIQQDTRHGDAAMLEFVPIASRTFNHWSMAYVGASSNESPTFADIARQSGFDPAKLSGEQLFERLREMVSVELPEEA